MSSQRTQQLPKIELYYFANASSLAIHTLLIEANLPFMAHEVTTSAESQARLLQVSPKGRVPVLVLDYQDTALVPLRTSTATNGIEPSSIPNEHQQVTITETLAIATAISDLVPHKYLLGSDYIQKAQVYEWLSWMMSSVHATGWVTVFRPERFLGTTTDDADVAEYEAIESSLKDRVMEQGLTRLRDMYGRLEAILVQQKSEGVTGDFAVGDQLTAVDGLLYVLFRWATEWGVVVEGGSHPQYWAMMERFEQRSASRQALKEEGLSPTIANLAA